MEGHAFQLKKLKVAFDDLNPNVFSKQDSDPVDKTEFDLVEVEKFSPASIAETKDVFGTRPPLRAMSQSGAGPTPPELENHAASAEGLNSCQAPGQISCLSGIST